ncbi:unnamed protein product [Echinostoma caproni]|uniref:Ovule protein n=1 Tax=Echinostoma caproni TaxID=27848 RepID=A0A183ARJ7_9TREM|nr:unnamed protein product [Echinostoma caproni]
MEILRSYVAAIRNTNLGAHSRMTTGKFNWKRSKLYHETPEGDWPPSGSNGRIPNCLSFETILKFAEAVTVGRANPILCAQKQMVVASES